MTMVQPTLPDAWLNVKDGALGLAPSGTPGIFAQVGVASQGDVNTPLAFVDADDVEAVFGTGALPTALRDALQSGARFVLGIRVQTPANGQASVPVKSSEPFVSDPKQTGTGTGHVSAVGDPSVDGLVEIEILTTGAVGVATFQWRLNGGEWSAPVAISAEWLLPGTDVVLHFADGASGDSFVDGDTWALLIAAGGTGALATTGSPTAGGDVEVEVVEEGPFNEATFRYRIDGGPWSTPATITAVAVAIASLGLSLQFAEGDPAVVSFVPGTRWTFTATAPYTTVQSLSDAIKSLLTVNFPVEWIHVVGATDSSVWTALQALAESEFTARFRYLHIVCEARGPGAQESVDAWVAALNADAAGVTGVRLSVVAAQAEVTDAVTGVKATRNGGGIYTGRLSKMGVNQSPEAPIEGALPLLKTDSLRPVGINEGHIGLLDTVGKFITFRAFEGMPGLYITNARMMVADTSDFRWVVWRRVMDKACREVRLAGLRSLFGDADEAGLAALKDALEQPLARMKSAREINAFTVTIPGNQDFIASSAVRVKIRIQPTPKMRWIELEIGFENPFRQAA